MFTGDRSGDFLYRSLHQTGFANQAESRARGDGLKLRGVWITAAARCAPPDNKPLPEELANCRPYLEAELDVLGRVRVVVALGRIAFNAYLGILKDRGAIATRTAFPFGHGAEHRPSPDGPALLASYHPSQQNTSTGRLTQPMLTAVFSRAREIMNERRVSMRPGADSGSSAPQ
jgi:uracil-DNA glycosylase family 4